MSLPEHLAPKTYWEKRTELMEESVERIVRLLVLDTVPKSTASALDDHMREWSRLIGDLANEFQKPNE